MKIVYIILSVCGLLLLLVPSLMHFRGNMDPELMKTLMFIGTVIWFSGAIPWLGKKKAEG